MEPPEVLTVPEWAAKVVAEGGLYPRQAVEAAEWIVEVRRGARRALTALEQGAEDEVRLFLEGLAP